MEKLIDPKVFRLELDKLNCIDKFGYIILPVTKLNIVLERSTVDESSVVRGEWVEPDDDYGYLVCSVCEERSPNDERWDFCPHCGANMMKYS